MTTPQSENELMVEFGRYMLIESFIAIGQHQLARTAANDMHDSLHIEAAESVRVQHQARIEPIGRMALRARIAMGEDNDKDAALTSIMSDMHNNLREMMSIFDRAPLGYFAEVFRDLSAEEPEALRNTLTAVVQFCRVE